MSEDWSSGFPQRTVLTVAGSLYLVWLGIITLRQPATVHASEPSCAGSVRRWWAKALGASGLNPKVFLLFLAILPQFVDAGADLPLALQIVLLGLVHGTSCAAVYITVGYCADVLLRSRPAAARVVSIVSGIAMIAIALPYRREPRAAVTAYDPSMPAYLERLDGTTLRATFAVQGAWNPAE